MDDGITQSNVARVDRQDVPQREPTSILDVIQNIASNPDLDIDRMERLLRLRAEEEDRIRKLDREDRAEAARHAWLREFSAAQAQIGPIVRNRTNSHTKSGYEDLAAIEKEVMPIMTSHGFSVRARGLSDAPTGHIRMELMIGHSEGHVETDSDIFPLDGAGSQGNSNKTPIQAKGSTETYARRYLLRRNLNLSSEDGDGNGTKPPDETITVDQFDTLRGLIAAAGIDVDVVLKAERIEALDFLPADRFPALEKRLRLTVAKRKDA